MLRALVLTLVLATPAAAQEMTKAQEQAYTRLWEMTVAANALHAAGDLAGAEAGYAETLSLIDRELPDEPLTRAAALHNLAAVRADRGRLQDAEETAREVLRLRLENGGATTAVASTHRLLSSILRDLDRIPEARAEIEAAVILTLNDPAADNARLVADFTGLAVMTAETGDHAGAAELMGQLEPLLPDLSPANAARVFVALGRVESLAGRPERAELGYREAAARSAAIPADDPDWTLQDRANVIGNLASMLLQQSREREAEPLFREALTLAQGLSPLVRANLLDGLGTALAAQGQMQAAWDAQRQALDLRIAALPPNHPALAASFALTGETILRAGDPATARDALSRAVEIATEGNDPLRAARAALRLAAAEAAMGDTAFGRAEEAETVLAGLLPAGHPEVAGARFIAASIALAENNAPAALPLARQALAGITDRLARAGADATVAATGGTDLRRMVLPVASAAWGVDRQGLMDEAFRAVQWATMTAASRATQRMAARTAAADGELAALARSKQDLVNQWQEADRAYLAALSQGDTDAERARLDSLESAIAEAESDLAARFPAYAALVTPAPLAVAEVQSRLGPDETLLMFATAPAETFVFAITADGATWHRADLPAQTLADRVARLRADLDPVGPARAAVALDDSAGPRIRPFDRATAHALYADLIAPLAASLRPRVLVVADGALTSLPLAVLVTAPPEGADDDPASLAATSWLADGHAFATLPSVRSLASLRDLPRGTVAASGFVGFGAPDFTGTGRPPDPVAAFDGATARTAALRALAPLPGTRRELSGLARQLGAADAALHLGSRATEAAVRQADLTGARILAFATHGLLAGEIAGLAEPALAFTPPLAPTAADDGLLTASEVLDLRLAADWVILSACNTAGADGTPGADGLSGLASAFLYAGARGLLVSHWPVGDAAAERLTQRAVGRLLDNPDAGQAGALAGAMDDLRADPAFAHPAAWAPFVVVGDGR
ncbi:MAG: CHAT domain-containing protein [Paracoccaceae bacterium]|nr:MAG: CHAT domain-containing protein [Paracoccaceae bacterium]